jgi:hypothetical protein
MTATGTGTALRDPGALSGPLAGISFIAGVGGGVATANSPYPRPGSKPEEIRKYFGGSARSARMSAIGQAISTAALVRFTASVVRFIGRSGPGARPLQEAATAGGAVAAASLATSAVCAAALTGRSKDDDESAVKVHRLAFAAGGPVHGAGFGILVGALSLAGLRSGELPRPVAITGLVSAATGLLGPLYFVTEPAAWFIPVGRFSGLVVSGIAGARLSGLAGAAPSGRG